MSIGAFFAKLTAEAITALKNAGVELEQLVISDTQAEVAKIKQLPFVTSAMGLIGVLENSSLSGSDRMAKVVSFIVTSLQEVQAAGGLGAVATSIENLAIEAGQSLFNDFKADISKVIAGI